MTSIQMFTIIGAQIGILALFFQLTKHYIDAKIDPIAKDVSLLVQYMISHEGKINKLEERTKNL